MDRELAIEAIEAIGIVERAAQELAAYRALGAPEQLAARVEVVRCGECVNRFTAHCPMAFESIHPDLPSYAGDITEWTEDDWYCQRGTRADAKGVVRDTQL